MGDSLRRIPDGGTLSRQVIGDNDVAIETQTVLQGGVGILSGLALTAGSGLTLNVASGTVQGSKAAYVPGFSGVAPDNATRYVWLDFAQDTGVARSGDDAPTYVGSLVFTTTFAQPGGNLACLGKVTTASGAITVGPTTEGRMVLSRWTGLQTYAIGDTVTVDSGLGNIDAVGVLTAGSYGATLKTVAGADITLTATEARALSLILSGTPGASRNLIVPNLIGKVFAVRNGTDSTVTVKTPSGTGVAIATNKSAFVLCDGTNVVRLTPDA